MQKKHTTPWVIFKAARKSDCTSFLCVPSLRRRRAPAACYYINISAAWAHAGFVYFIFSSPSGREEVEVGARQALESTTQ